MSLDSTAKIQGLKFQFYNVGNRYLNIVEKNKIKILGQVKDILDLPS